ncbi:MAG: ABC transporter permease [Chloroflexi bacterium]|nr:ABC transporter permease [Chloroflexota bacterium]
MAMGRVLPLPLASGRAVHVVERNLLVYRRTWWVLLSGFFEPVFYLLGLGFGLGAIVGDVGGIPYAMFVAPALLATSAMNGAIYDSTFNVFYKLKYARTYDAMLSTPLGVPDVATGEIAWALGRGLIYAAAFMVVMLLLGLVATPLALLAVPASVLIGFAAAGLGTAATTFVRSWQDFDLVFVITLPLFLFSATFFPITTYEQPLRTLVELTPLYRGVHMIRALTTDTVDIMIVVDVAYLVVLGLIGLAITARRLDKLLLK